ncbi:MAG: 16S rRNA (adenine(1518)-N(6)/adenine(1519)-N(6))-dimethyltransferase RsmA [Acidobacteriia bacterium]|nr:16S rRNA (adenine(1518)-N(6)/adenine(1519)-N(6))-dimethyltransferase RsmA [Terriglobia bacterium]
MRAFTRSKPDPPRARRRFGQHFLADSRAVHRIVDALAPAADEPVLEIGPGQGALTSRLIGAASRIAAVEVDRGLAAALRQRFDPEKLLLFERDVLSLDLADVAPALSCPPGAPLAVVGNLPYNISKPVAMKLVAERESVSRAVLMFQREVADRLTAGFGTRAYGPLTVLAGRAYRVTALFDLSPAAFRPRPAVTSTVTRWERRPPDDLPPALEPALRACLAACFAHRRQTLLNNVRAALPGGVDEARALLASAGLDPGARAEAVPPEGFLILASFWPRGD